ncbi:MAG: twin-arginine translocation signal domain-containing protein [Acidobacteria bacterium]|nr:twin-arginine translocation signal domain-containing protein [Acidobacteriota bacterium]
MADAAAVTRRGFLGGAALAGAAWAANDRVQTVRGPRPAHELGMTLIHEHILVDFIGAEQARPDRYDAGEVFEAALPHLRDLRARGCSTLVECTPAYLGRDPELLRRLSLASGLHIITNTGYYGANRDKHLPRHAFEESADSLAARWTREWREGIGRSRIRPGFLKIGVDAGPLSDIDRKLVQAAARCHLRTGLRIHAHTGPAAGAMDIIAELRRERVHPKAYVWVHAQNEKDRKFHLEAARAGAWIEFDGVRAQTLDAHADAVMDLHAAGFLDQALISQDSGWYRVGEPGGGKYNGYTFLFDSFVPELRQRGMRESEINTLLVLNPARALTPGVRRA